MPERSASTLSVRTAIAKPILKTSNLSVTRTFRIDKDVDNKLADLAGGERVSMNVIANKALRRYVEWEANAEKFGTVTTSSSTIKKFFDYLTDEQAKEMGKWWGENQVPGIITFYFKKFDFDSVLKALEFLGAQYGRAFTFDHSYDGRTHTLIVKHDMGFKASVFYAEAVKAAFAHLGLGTDIFVTEDQLIGISPPDPTHPLNRSSEGSTDLKYSSTKNPGTANYVINGKSRAGQQQSDPPNLPLQ